MLCMSTCNWLDLESLRSWPTMPKSFPGTIAVTLQCKRVFLDNYEGLYVIYHIFVVTLVAPLPAYFPRVIKLYWDLWFFYYTSSTKVSYLRTLRYLMPTQAHKIKLVNATCSKPIAREVFGHSRSRLVDVKNLPTNFPGEVDSGKGSPPKRNLDLLDPTEKFCPPARLNSKTPLPLHSWRPLIHKSHIECTSPSRSKIQYTSSLPLSK